VPAALTEQARSVDATVEARAQVAQAAAERRESVSATATAQAADRQVAAEARAAQATGTAEVDSRPPFGLIGQQFSTCSERRIPLDVVVEDAEVFPHPDGGWAVVAVVRVTNRGSEGTESYVGLHLQDRRGRDYDYKLADRGIDLYSFQQKYDARAIRTYVQPGLSLRQVWGFVVPTDVMGLRPLPGRFNTCGR
jgi:hypothetical protein